MLYPLKFRAIKCPKIWGYESWQLSGYGDQVSVVSNGYLADNELNELIEVYMDELVGQHVYDRYGCQFPLLCKFIHAEDDLSIQVHPSDEQAKPLGIAGKTEMWYVTEAEQDASMVLGFARDTSREEFQTKLADGSLMDLMQVVRAKAGNVAFLPAGIVHALRRGTTVAEIQQTSDSTYRIYDYNRRDSQGKLRPLHVDQALDVMNYHRHDTPLVDYSAETNRPVELVRDSHFVTRLLRVEGTMECDYAEWDSMVVYMCTSGRGQVLTEADEAVTLAQDETLLLPASLPEVRLVAESGEWTLLEVHC